MVITHYADVACFIHLVTYLKTLYDLSKSRIYTLVTQVVIL